MVTWRARPIHYSTSTRSASAARSTPSPPCTTSSMEWVHLRPKHAHFAICSTFVSTEKFNNGLCTNFLQFHGLKSSCQKIGRRECTLSRDFYFGSWLLNNLWLDLIWWYYQRWREDILSKVLLCPVADPGFPRGMPIPEGCTNLLFGIFFCQKLHENENKLTERGVHIPRVPLPSHHWCFQNLDSKLFDYKIENVNIITKHEIYHKVTNLLLLFLGSYRPFGHDRRRYFTPAERKVENVRQGKVRNVM